MRAVLRRVASEREGRLGLLFTLAVLLFAILGPLVSPDPNRIDVASRFLGPSLLHPLGTDNLGRDELARVSLGARTALLYALVIVGAAATAGAAIGVAAAMAGGWTDRIVTGLFDVVSAFPPLILAFGLIALYGSGPSVFLTLATVVFTPQFGRVARARAQSLRDQSFVEAERLLGLHPARIVARHILPNVAAPVLVVASMNVPSVITFEAGLSFLGLGVKPPGSSLGTLIKDGYLFLNDSAWPVTFACAVLVVATLGSTFLGESLRRALDPKGRTA